MLFFKSKPKPDELLPPPPPFPSMEIEEKGISKENIELSPKKSASEDEFDDLFKEVKSLGKKEEKLSKPAKEKKAGIKLPKMQVKKLPKLKKEKIKSAAKLPQKSPKKKVLPAKKPAAAKRQKIPKQLLKRQRMKARTSKPTDSGFEDLGIEGLQVPEPREIKLDHELEFPKETKEENEMENIGKFLEKDFEFNIQSKPREIQEAENEIKGAIEKIRDKEKPSFFRRLFARKENGKGLTQQIYEKDDVSAINNRISKARESLTKFELDEARQNYVEAMEIYKRMNPEEQAKVYHEIRDLYYERKSAEQLKV